MRTKFALPIFAAFVLFLISGCTKDQCKTSYTYTVYEPVYMEYAELRESVASEPARSLKSLGKIYLYNNYLFVNELNEGVHVINNNDPHNPVIESFIKIPGNVDIAIRNGILYADSYIDLVAIDIRDIHNVAEISRIEEVFPQNLAEFGYYADLENGIVVDWVETDRTETYEVDCQGGEVSYYNGYPYYVEFDNVTGGPVLMSDAGGFTPGVKVNTGVAGSMARFTIGNDFLYAVDNSDMHLIDISSPTQPAIWNKINVGFNIETIFPYQENLFIGSQQGMYIYDISSPASPQHLSTYQHITSCDPVVVEGNYAYVTLRSGNPCAGFTNQLDVIDVSNLSAPTRLKSYEMFNPHGLGIDKGMLFICDGKAGLKVFGANDPLAIDQNLVEHFGNIQATDVIPLDNNLIMVGEGGIYQYNYVQNQSIDQISLIPVN